MAIQFLDDIAVQGGLTISGSISATNISSSVNYVQSPKTVVNSISGISQILVMDQTTYDTLSPKNPTTMYVIV